MQTKGIPAGQSKGSGCVKSQTYQGAATKYEWLVYDVVKKTSTRRRSRIPWVVVKKKLRRVNVKAALSSWKKIKSRRIFNKNYCDLFIAITHTKILVAYFIISNKLKYKWRITAARPTHYFVGIIFLYFWVTVCKTVHPMLSDRCLSFCLSCLCVTLVYCGQTVQWLKNKLGMEVGLGPGHIVLDGDPAPLIKKGQQPQFSVHVCCGQIAGLIKMPLSTQVDLGPGDIVLDGNLARPQRGAQHPQFWPTCCGQTAAWIKVPLGTGVGLCPGHIVLHEDPAPR